jgi:hypothetical protein
MGMTFLGVALLGPIRVNTHLTWECPATSGAVSFAQYIICAFRFQLLSCPILMMLVPCRKPGSLACFVPLCKPRSGDLKRGCSPGILCFVVTTQPRVQPGPA